MKLRGVVVGTFFALWACVVCAENDSNSQDTWSRPLGIEYELFPLRKRDEL